MKLIKKLYINGEPVEFSDDDIRLFSMRSGKASFTVFSSEPLTGIVQFVLGYEGRKTYNYFFGYITDSIKQNKDIQIIKCDELIGALKSYFPITLENVTLKEIIAYCAEETGLSFIVPDKAYSKTKVSQFYNIASGYNALDSLGEIFNIDDYVWYQQGDGKVFAGSWNDSYFANKELPIDSTLFDDFTSTNSAKIAVQPYLRPLVSLNGQRVNSVQMIDVFQVIKCVKR